MTPVKEGCNYCRLQEHVCEIHRDETDPPRYTSPPKMNATPPEPVFKIKWWWSLAHARREYDKWVNDVT